MDSGWAVVLGAAIAFLGSGLVPWLRESLTERRARERERRVALANAIREIVSVATAKYASDEEEWTPADFGREEVALVNFALLVSAPDTPVVDMTERALLLLSWDEDLDRKGALAGLGTELREWYCGTQTAAETLESFLEDLDVPADADPFHPGRPDE